MNGFNKEEWLQKTEEYLIYIDRHKKNIAEAWRELRTALKDIGLVKWDVIQCEMEARIEYHDDSKLDEGEFLPYRQKFYPVSGEIVSEDSFAAACQRHYFINDHHWQHWFDKEGNFEEWCDVRTKMCAFIEMICDWQAMSYEFGGSAPKYFRENKDKIRIDPNWLPFVEEILDCLEQHLSQKESCV